MRKQFNSLSLRRRKRKKQDTINNKQWRSTRRTN